jgi:hypothetical protein
MAGISGENNPKYRHGLAIVGKKDGLYYSWMNMRQRCGNPNNAKFHRYGGRGITVCDSWNDITVFREWALNAGWQKGLVIDRINNDGNYCPENCQWVSASLNSRKKSTTKLSEDDAHAIRYRLLKGDNEYKIAEDFGVTHGTVWFIKNGITHVPDAVKSSQRDLLDRVNQQLGEVQ